MPATWGARCGRARVSRGVSAIWCVLSTQCCVLSAVSHSLRVRAGACCQVCVCSCPVSSRPSCCLTQGTDGTHTMASSSARRVHGLVCATFAALMSALARLVSFPSTPMEEKRYFLSAELALPLGGGSPAKRSRGARVARTPFLLRCSGLHEDGRRHALTLAY